MARGACTVDGWFGVIGVLVLPDSPLRCTLVVYNRSDRRCIRCATCHNIELETCGRSTFVTSGIGRGNGQGMGTVSQRDRWGKRPVAVGGDDAANRHTVVIDGDQTAGLGSTGQIRTCIVGCLTRGQVAGYVALIIDYGIEGRRNRRCSIDNDCLRVRWLAFVTRRVGDYHHEHVRAFGQFRIRGELPLAVFSYHCGADFNAVIDDGHDIARLTAAADQGRSGVVSRVAITDAALLRANVIQNVINTTSAHTRLTWSSDVDNDRER